jgi:molybdenum cofactor cytidylyltransferase
MSAPIPLDRVVHALKVQPRECIALTGGGGKTTTLFALAHGLRGRVIATTTTKMGARQTSGLTPLTDPSRIELSIALSSGPALVNAGIRDTKALGVQPRTCDVWFADVDLCDYVVIEADGARTRPFKAPAPHEPVIPSLTTLAISIIGADALGRVIADQCQRPMRVAALAGCSPYERLEPERAARVVRHERGGGKGVPPNARRVVMITKVPISGDDPVTAQLVDEFVAHLTPHVEVIAIERSAHGYRAAPW